MAPAHGEAAAAGWKWTQIDITQTSKDKAEADTYTYTQLSARCMEAASSTRRLKAPNGKGAKFK